jgi:cytochrome P450
MQVTAYARNIDEELTALFSGDPDTIRNPYPLYRRLREESPVHRFGSTYILTRHRDVKGAYREPARFAATPARHTRFADSQSLFGATEHGLFREIVEFESAFMSRLNGDDHFRVRQAGQRAFTPKRLEQMRETIEGLTDRLLAPLAAEESSDWIRFAYRLPLLVIMEMLAVPHEDADRLKVWGDLVNEPGARSPIPPAVLHSAHDALGAYSEYVLKLVERHRREPGRTDLVAALLGAEEGDRLTERELVANIVLMLFAGHETTTYLFANGLIALMENRDQWELLCSDPSLVPSAVEELLRYDPTTQFIAKVAACDLEIDGVVIPEGSIVMLGDAAANRDPEVFPDPDRLDITRRPNDHMTFGFGIHFCLGGPLARQEGQVVFRHLAERFPDLRLAAPAEDLVWKPGLRGVRSLPVKWGLDRRSG